MKQYEYFKNCTEFTQAECNKPGGLSDCIDNALDITRATFLKHVDTDLAEHLGYAKHWKQGLTMAADYHISYHRSRLNDKRVYFFKWSGIEHIYKEVKV